MDYFFSLVIFSGMAPVANTNGPHSALSDYDKKTCSFQEVMHSPPPPPPPPLPLSNFGHKCSIYVGQRV